MIPKISRGQSTRGLLRYLYGPGKRKEHTDPHLVASWDGFLADPGRDPDATLHHLARALDLRMAQAGDQAPAKHVWHCSLRTGPTDPVLSDEQWAEAARRVLHATGIAPDGDPDACRWVAVRHAEDHIHILATLVRSDLRTAHAFRDYLKANEECARIEKEWGLVQVERGDRTAAQRPTNAERRKAERHGQDATPRELLREAVRRALAGAATEHEFFTRLTEQGVRYKLRTLPSGDISGYTVAWPGDTTNRGEPVWFSGSKLAPSLSLPEIRKRLTGDQSATRPANAWHTATTAVHQAATALHADDDAATQAHLDAFGGLLDAAAQAATAPSRAELRRAALAFERATRSTIRADHRQAAELRRVARELLYTAAGGEGAAAAVLLSALVSLAILAARWHETRTHRQQAAAAWQTLAHLQTAYHQTAAPVLADLARRQPGPAAVRRYETDLRRALPEHADRILADPAWAALTTALARAEESGRNVRQVLAEAARQSELGDLGGATPPAEDLTWRLQHRAEQALHARIQVATARSRQRMPSPKPNPSPAPHRTEPATSAIRPRRR